MASTVAGAIKWISSTLIDEGKYLYGVEDHLRNLQRDLRYMHLFLQKVEENPKPLRDDDPLLILTEEMRDLAIRAEDAVSIYRVDVESHFRSTNFLSKACCLASHSYPVHVLRTEIDAIQTEIEEAMRRSEKFGKHIQNLEHQLGSAIRPSSSRPNPENFLHLDNEFVVGIKDDIANLVKRLTNPEDEFRVLGIVGTGGAGKSTLATQIYRHKEVQSWFTHKVFVCVSQEWDSIDLLSRIYKQIMQVTDDTPSDKNVLLKTLHDFMKDKRCLVVLDDLWDKIAYNAIHPIFPPAEGIKIIITTRKEEVILHADTKAISHVPKLLTKEEMLELFKMIAIDGREDIVKDDRYLKLGVQMLEKIQGLPLAVVTLAGILRTKRHLNEWKRINEACSSNILIEDAGLKYGAVKEMLGLSYLDLPTHVKPCFLYLGIIPKDNFFWSQTMAHMWIAEGFITDDLRMGEETLEDVAMRVLDELAHRCILQITNRDELGQSLSFRMHDLMREFCITTASQCSFLKVVTPTNPDAQARRLSICSWEYDPQENQHLRTLVYLNEEWNRKEDAKNLESIDKKFKVLRVLSIRNVKCALPKNIGNLVYLTYLSLVHTGITILPESIRNLRNLLYFEYNEIIAVVPNNLVGNMENLRSVVLPARSENVDGLGFSNGRHKKLHTFISGAGRWMRKDLQALSSSLLNLEIYGIENAEELQALSSSLNHNLRTLALKLEEGVQFELDKLLDCQNLRRLTFQGPVANLVSFELPSNLVYLRLQKTGIGEGVDLLEALGRLSQLKFLYLCDDAFVGEKLSCESGDAFPQLQELVLSRLNGLEEWEMERGAMKVLRRIELFRCPRLKKLPECIRYIYTLEKLKATGMSGEFVKRYEGYGRVAEPGVIYDDDYKIIQHIPSVHISRYDVLKALKALKKLKAKSSGTES